MKPIGQNIDYHFQKETIQENTLNLIVNLVGQLTVHLLLAFDKDQ